MTTHGMHMYIILYIGFGTPLNLPCSYHTDVLTLPLQGWKAGSHPKPGANPSSHLCHCMSGANQSELPNLR